MAAVLVISFSSTAFSKDLKVGYVDIFKIFNEYAKTKEYDKVLEQEKEERKKELDKKKEIIEKMQGKLGLLKEKEQAKEKEKLALQVDAYREAEREIFTDLKKKRDDKMKEIVEDINKVIEEYAKKYKFDLVINENAVLYGKKAMNITASILKLVNKRYKK